MLVSASQLSNGVLTDWYTTYKNSSSSWFTVINANIGYEYKAGKTGTLRIEPYLKIPERLRLGQATYYEHGNKCRVHKENILTCANHFNTEGIIMAGANFKTIASTCSNKYLTLNYLKKPLT